MVMVIRRRAPAQRWPPPPPPRPARGISFFITVDLQLPIRYFPNGACEAELSYMISSFNVHIAYGTSNTKNHSNTVALYKIE